MEEKLGSVKSKLPFQRVWDELFSERPLRPGERNFSSTPLHVEP